MLGAVRRTSRAVTLGLGGGPLEEQAQALGEASMRATRAPLINILAFHFYWF